MIKHGKIIIFITSAIILGLISSLVYINIHQDEIEDEIETIALDNSNYKEKKDECSGITQTTSSVVNNAGLSDCGIKLAVETLQFKSLYEIYHTYCNQGFGMAVYGCAYPLTKSVYVCSPGTTLYDQRNTYVSRYYIQYQYISYACNDKDIGNTIRHELLHLVYSALSESEQLRVKGMLSSYEAMYANAISSYGLSERDDELFVRVGADGRYIDDIELVDLYAKVSSAYIDQKKEYYGSLVKMTDNYLEKYNNISDDYSTLRVIIVILIIINGCFLIISIILMSKKTNEKKPKDKNSDGLFSKKMWADSDSRQNANKNGRTNNQRSKNGVQKEFDEFKRRYGVVDIDDEDEDEDDDC